MARPPEQAIDEAIAALGHFELVELGAAVSDLREELEAERALADRLADEIEALYGLQQWNSKTNGALVAYRERRG